MTNVIFKARDEVLFNFAPHPKPITTSKPEWFKKMPPLVNNDPNLVKNDVFLNDGSISFGGTLKRCPPVQDIINAGYLISTHCDILVNCDRKNNIMDLHWTLNHNIPVIETHNYAQIKGSIIEKFAIGDNIFKYINPWYIQTDPGYSCLFLAPQYHDLPLTILSGIVQTDKQPETNFPFLYNGPDGQTVIPAGTPLVQVIPFKREKYTSEVTFASPVENATMIAKVQMIFTKQYLKVKDKAMKFL